MILGNGDIARVLKNESATAHKKRFIFFASGVSNSHETRESEYKREEKLLLKQNKRKHIVYFSSLSIFYNANSRYARHKKYMEDLIKKHFTHYTIVRMGNIIWGTNPHTFINYFRSKVKRGKKVEIWDTYRYLVNKKEFLHWISLVPDWNCEMNITGTRLKVAQIVKKYVKQ